MEKVKLFQGSVFELFFVPISNTAYAMEVIV